MWHRSLRRRIRHPASRRTRPPPIIRFVGRLAVTSLVAAVLLAAPAAGAQAPPKPEDVQRVERAVLELSAAKRDLAGEVAAGKRAAERVLAKCRSKGPGWARIRAVRVPAQRGLYTRGARTLWRDLAEVAAERAAFEAYRRPFERFLSRFEPPLADPVLHAGVEAWSKRVALYAAYTPVGTCRTFNRLASRARQFPANVEADYLAGDIYNRMVRFVDDTKRKAARRHWGSRYERALDAARAQLVALGGNEGYATFFAFGHSLRG
jgi:hypothetical protein